MILIEYSKYLICKVCLFAGFTFFITLTSFSQDTLQSVEEVPTILKKEPEKPEDVFEKERKHALTATLLSTAIPGAGQLYNGKWWKVPIIYGLGTYVTYTAFTNHDNYKLYQESLYHIQEKNELGYSYSPYHLGDDTTASLTAIREKKNEYRKKRDRSILYLTLIYALNIVDANVDAHLQGFEVRKDMIMTFRTDLIDDKRLLVGFNLTF